MDYSNSELIHYGVLSMRWSVRRTPEQLRRAAGQLSAKNSKYKDIAVKENVKATQGSPKAAKLRSKAAKARKKEYGLFTSKKKADELEYKAKKYEARAAILETKGNKHKAKADKFLAKIDKNNEKISTFINTAKALESGKVLKGNQFVMKYEQATIDAYTEDEKRR